MHFFLAFNNIGLYVIFFINISSVLIILFINIHIEKHVIPFEKKKRVLCHRLYRRYVFDDINELNERYRSQEVQA